MYRKRSEGGFYPLEAQTGQTHSDCSVTTGSASIPDALGYRAEMVDVVTEDYRAKRARGEIIINPMSRWETERTAGGSIASYSCPASPCVQSIFWTNGYWYLRPSSLGLMKHAGRWWEFDQRNLQLLAGTQAHANVSSPEWEGLVFFAELKETLQMLVNPIMGFQRLATLAKKHKRLAARCKRRSRRGKLGSTAVPKWLRPHCHPRWGDVTVFDFMSNFWLQYRLGVKPFAYDVENLITAAIASERLNRPRKRIARGSADDSLVRKSTDVFASTWIATRKIETNVVAKARAGVIYQPTSEETFGFSWQELPSAAWEAATLSFVVDRFSNVGDWIRALVPKKGVRYLGEWTSFKVEVKSSGLTSSTWNGSAGCTEIASPWGNEHLLSTYYNRTPVVNVGLALKPVPLGDLSSLGINTAKKHVLDHLAILRGILRSK